MKECVVVSRAIEIICALCFSTGLLNAQTMPLSLRDAIDRALLNNRQLQIESINPDLARLTLKAAYGVYDPVFESRLRTESASDTGGFDPANFSADAIYSADSEVVSLGLLGVLPTGLTYSLGGNYAHSYGTRNFLDFDSYKVGTGITLEQPLLKNLWIDEPRWIIQINKRNLKISELGVHYVAMTVINLTRQGYYDLISAWENLRVNQNLLATKEEFVRGVRRQVQLGFITANEEKLGLSQTASLQTDVVTASNAVSLASNNLKTLMGIEGTDWTDAVYLPSDAAVLVPEQLDLQSSWRTGLEARPDLAQLALNLENADLTVKFRKNQLFPTLNLFGSYGLKGADAIQAFPGEDPRASASFALRELREQAAPNSTIGILFSLPLTRTRERANYKASKELQQQAELLLKQKQELVMREIADAIDLARHSFHRAEAARTAVKFAEEAVTAEEQKLRAGGGSIFFVLQAQTDAARARLAELAARRDYNKALSQLYFTEGTLLQKSDIEVVFDE